MLAEDAFRLGWLQDGYLVLSRVAHSLRGLVSSLRGFTEYARGGVLRFFFSVTAPDGWTALGGRGGITDFNF